MNSSYLSNRFSEELSTNGGIDFSYDMLGSATRIVVQQRTTEIKNLLRRSAQDIVDIGLKLIEVKQELGHGYFLAWLRTEFNWSESAARKFMQTGRKFKTVNFTNLDIATSALYLLAADSTSETAREEALQRARAGEVITRAKAKDIAQQHAQITQIENLNTIDVEAENISVIEVEKEDCNNKISVSNNVECYLELSNRLHLLDENQIARLWQALSKQLNPKHLDWYTWSKGELENLLDQVQQELSIR